MSQRRVKIPMVLVFALVQGMWMGAQVHGLAAGHANPLHGVSYHEACGCRAPQPASQPVLQKSAADCSVCATGALMQDSPAAHFASIPREQSVDAAPEPLTPKAPTAALPQHPGRGPPVLA